MFPILKRCGVVYSMQRLNGNGWIDRLAKKRPSSFLLIAAGLGLIVLITLGSLLATESFGGNGEPGSAATGPFTPETLVLDPEPTEPATPAEVPTDGALTGPIAEPETPPSTFSPVLATSTPKLVPASTIAPTASVATLVPILPTGPSLSINLTVGTASGAPGEKVTLPIFLRSGANAVQGIQVSLKFDGLALTVPTAEPGDALPGIWYFAHHSPDPSSLNFLALDFEGIGSALNGVVFSATFVIDAAALDGDFPVTVSLAEARGGPEEALTLNSADGVVRVISTGGAN